MDPQNGLARTEQTGFLSHKTEGMAERSLQGCAPFRVPAHSLTQLLLKLDPKWLLEKVMQVDE